MIGLDPAQSKFLDSFSEEERQRLGTYCQEMRFSAEQTVIRTEGADASLYLVLSGLAEARGQSRYLGEQTINLIGPGSIIGEIAFLDSGNRTSDVVARDDMVLWRLRQSQFDLMAREDPALALTLMRALARTTALRLRRMTAAFLG